MLTPGRWPIPGLGRDAYLGDAAAAAGLCKHKGGKKRKSADEAPQHDCLKSCAFI